MSLPRILPLSFLLVTFGAMAPLRAETKAPVVATCVKSWGEVRARAYGYDHFVVMQSTCKKAAVCAVSSDVNPDAQSVSLTPGESTEVATSLGVPASTFLPKVVCTLP